MLNNDLFFINNLLSYKEMLTDEKGGGKKIPQSASLWRYYLEKAYHPIRCIKQEASESLKSVQ